MGSREDPLAHWARLADVKHLVAYSDYLEAMGVETAAGLPPISGNNVSGAKKVSIKRSETHNRERTLKSLKITPSLFSWPTPLSMPTELSKEQVDACKRYAAKSLDYCKGRGPHPGACPERWYAFSPTSSSTTSPRFRSITRASFPRPSPASHPSSPLLHHQHLDPR